MKEAHVGLPSGLAFSKNPPANAGDSLNQVREYPLENEIATTPVFCSEIPWTEEHGSYSPEVFSYWTRTSYQNKFTSVIC